MEKFAGFHIISRQILEHGITLAYITFTMRLLL